MLARFAASTTASEEENVDATEGRVRANNYVASTAILGLGLAKPKTFGPTGGAAQRTLNFVADSDLYTADWVAAFAHDPETH